MTITKRKNSLVLGTLSKAFYDLPVSVNLNIWWNFGSLLGFCLVIQIVSGVSLAMHYVPHVDLAYDSVIHIMRDVNHGWVLRSVHANGASFFFLCVYAHIGRGIYYGSYQLVGVWVSGVVLLILLMATAFMGYVLPWGQMSYWGAVVITNMVTVIPYVGKDLLYWIWGGYTVGQATLLRFYVFHFLFPFLIALVVVVHLVYLHKVGGNNPLGIYSPGDDIPFHPYYTYKDLVGFSMLSWAMAYVCLLQPDLFVEPENYNKANPLVTPVHIQPEWYFLFAYAILRSIPNKTGGVVALVCSILVLLTLPVSAIGYYGCLSSSINPVNQVVFWFFVGVFCMLTWLGSCPVEEPYVSMGLTYTKLYFSFFVVYPLVMRLWWWVLSAVRPEGIDFKYLFFYPKYVFARLRFWVARFLWGNEASKAYITWADWWDPDRTSFDPHEFPVKCASPASDKKRKLAWRKSKLNWVDYTRTRL